VNTRMTVINIAIAATLSFVPGAVAFAAEEAPPPVSAKHVRAEVNDAIEAISNYVESQRSTLETKAEEFVAGVNAKINEARSELAEVPAESREALEAAVDRTEKAINTAEGQLAEIRKVTGKKWEATKGRLTAALEEVDEAQQEVSAALAGKS
jgi:CHASE3 domain sensor protein